MCDGVLSTILEQSLFTMLINRKGKWKDVQGRILFTSYSCINTTFRLWAEILNIQLHFSAWSRHQLTQIQSDIVCWAWQYKRDSEVRVLSARHRVRSINGVTCAPRVHDRTWRYSTVTAARWREEVILSGQSTSTSKAQSRPALYSKASPVGRDWEYNYGYNRIKKVIMHASW